MSRKTPEKKKARDLQRRTGWSYSECLRCVKTMTEDDITALIAERMGVHTVGEVDLSPGSPMWAATLGDHPIRVTPRMLFPAGGVCTPGESPTGQKGKFQGD